MAGQGLLLRSAAAADRRAMTSAEQAARGLLQAQGIRLDELLVPEHFEDDTRWDIALVAELGRRVVALVRLTDLDGSTLALDQLSVHPAAARKGIGRALLVELASVCRTRGYTTITGTTFREVLFNGPFYSSLMLKRVRPGGRTTPSNIPGLMGLMALTVR